MLPVAWGKAKHRIYLVRKEILALLELGKNLEEIYLQLKKANQLTVGKSTFKRYAAKIRDEHLGPKTPQKMNPHVNGASPIAPSAKSSVVSVAGQPTTTVLNKHTPATKTAIKHDPTSSDDDLNELYGIT